MKPFLLSIIIYFNLFALSAQVTTDDLTMGGANFNDQLNLVKGTDTKISNVNGNPFSSLDFAKGEIILLGDKVYKDIPLRINYYNQWIEFISHRKDTLAFTNIKIVKSLTINGKEFSVLNLINDENQIFEILQKNEYFNVLKLTSIKFYPKEEKKSHMESVRNARFQKERDQYFLKLHEKDILIDISDKRSLRKNDLINYNAIKKELRGFNFRNEDDIINIANLVFKAL